MTKRRVALIGLNILALLMLGIGPGLYDRTYPMPPAMPAAVISQKTGSDEWISRPSALTSDPDPVREDDALSLVGVVFSPDQKLAVVRASGVIQRLNEGDEIEGWRVIEIEPRWIEVERPGVVRRLSLDRAFE